MTDGQRRRLIILAETRAIATDASAVLQRLRVNLDQLKGTRNLPPTDPHCVASGVADELVERLIQLREWVNGQISEVPS